MNRRAREAEHRVRVAVIEQALTLGLPMFARVADSSEDPTEILEIAIRDVCDLLELDETAADAIRLAVTVGVLVGRLDGVIGSGRT